MSDEINNALVKDKDMMELMKNWLTRYTLEKYARDLFGQFSVI